MSSLSFSQLLMLLAVGKMRYDNAEMACNESRYFNACCAIMGNCASFMAFIILLVDAATTGVSSPINSFPLHKISRASVIHD